MLKSVLKYWPIVTVDPSYLSHLPQFERLSDRGTKKEWPDIVSACKVRVECLSYLFDVAFKIVRINTSLQLNSQVKL